MSIIFIVSCSFGTILVMLLGTTINYPSFGLRHQSGSSLHVFLFLLLAYYSPPKLPCLYCHSAMPHAQAWISHGDLLPIPESASDQQVSIHDESSPGLPQHLPVNPLPHLLSPLPCPGHHCLPALERWLRTGLPHGGDPESCKLQSG